MRVLLVGDGVFADRAGGGRRYLWGLATMLAAAGHQVDVLGPQLSPHLPRREVVDGVQIVRHAAPAGSAPWKVIARVAAAAQVARHLLDTHSYDVVNTHFAQTGFGAMLAGAGRSVPLLAHFQGPWAGEVWTERLAIWESASTAGRIQRQVLTRAICTLMHRLERKVMRTAGRVVVLSRFSRQVLAHVHGVPSDRILVIPGGFHPHRFPLAPSRAQARAALGLPAGAPLIFTARRLVRRMGLDLLLAAAAHLLRGGVAARWYIAGTGPLATELRERIAHLGLTERAVLLGRVPESDLPTWFGAADLCVVPSTAYEGFGLVSVESLSCGTPVVVTPTGANPEVVAPLAPWCVAPTVTAEALARTIQTALSGQLPGPQACRQYAVRRFGWETVYPLNEVALRWVATTASPSVASATAPSTN